MPSGERREFGAKIKAEVFLRQKGLCAKCGQKIEVGNIAYDHIIPDALCGEPTADNCEALHEYPCHKSKTKDDIGRIAKAKRIAAKHAGEKKSRNPIPGGRGTKWKKPFNGPAVRRG